MGAAIFTPAATIMATCEEIAKMTKHIAEKESTADPAYIESAKRVIQQHEAHLVEQCATVPDPQHQANILECEFIDGRISEAVSPPYKAALKALQDRIAAATGKPYEPDDHARVIYRIKTNITWLDREIADLEHVIRRNGSRWTPPELPAKLDAMKQRRQFLKEELAKITPAASK
jgi:hypothetical protein